MRKGLPLTGGASKGRRVEGNGKEEEIGGIGKGGRERGREGERERGEDDREKSI